MKELEVIERPGRPGQRPGPGIIILHGYGADNHDLASLPQVLRAPKGAHWYFPNGPFKVPLSPFLTGRSWFPMDQVAFDQAIASGRGAEFFSAILPDGLLEVAQRVKDLAREVASRHSEIFMGGFSQGAMVACQVALDNDNDDDIKKLIVLSGTLIAEKYWKKALERKKDIRLHIFQSHGRQDPLLPFEGALRLKEFFEAYCPGGGQGQNLTFVPFEGGHEIPPLVCERLSHFLLVESCE